MERKDATDCFGHKMLTFAFNDEEFAEAKRIAKKELEKVKRMNLYYRHNGLNPKDSQVVGVLGEWFVRDLLWTHEIKFEYNGVAHGRDFEHDFIIGSSQFGCKATLRDHPDALFNVKGHREKLWLYPAKRDPEVKKKRRTGYPEMLFCTGASFKARIGWIIGILDSFDIYHSPMKKVGNEMAHLIDHYKIDNIDYNFMKWLADVSRET
ncbi:MAG: hypothetical protein JRJ54_10640 [Deltaproteobacteria bacterium]|nr:hypothetical protein [Deltaproteobacteria bacterium]